MLGQVDDANRAGDAACAFRYEGGDSGVLAVLRPINALRFELEGKHSANRGDYRVIYEIDEAAHAVLILAIDHRSKTNKTQPVVTGRLS